LHSRVANLETWVRRLSRYAPVAALSLEMAKFDTQALMNLGIEGVEYQQGTLQGYEVREYLLEKWERRCAYCGVEGVPLQVEHIVPRIRGGSDRESNLALACGPCNQAKGSQTAEEFGYPEVQAQAQQPLRDAAAVNSTRWTLYRSMTAAGLPLEIGTGGRTKYNRTRLGLPKTHCLDAACVGSSTPDDLVIEVTAPLRIKAVGHGRRQRCGTDKHGFPIRHAPRAKRFMDYRTGDLVKAVVPQGKYAGTNVGRVAIRHRPSFRLNGFDIHPKYLFLLQCADGYEYEDGLPFHGRL
jgi:hypothetical protein